MEKLSGAMLPELRERPIRVLQYGEGNFLRAFVDWMLDELNRKTGFNGAAAVVQPIPQGRAGALAAQDCLYTLYLQGLRGGKPLREHRVISSIRTAIDPYQDYDAYEALARCETLRYIVSNTTEAGIAFHAGDRLTDRPPVGYPAKLAAFLYRRFQAFAGDPKKGCVILPCELIDRNGDRLRKLMLRCASEWELPPAFTDWLENACTFCCTLVDRIVSGYPKDDIAAVTAELGYEDALVDVGEQFHLWVIEGPEWIGRELPFAEAGLNVKFVGDVTPYRTRKVRILNGAHTALTPVAYLAGLDTVGEAVADPLVGKFVRGALYEEILPTLPMPEAELAEFTAAVLERFGNPYVRHYLTSIALNSVSKYKTRVLPTVTGALEKGGKPPRRLLFALSALFAFYRGQRDCSPIPLQDEAAVLEFFRGEWARCDGSETALRALAKAALAREDFWGRSLLALPGVYDAVTDGLCLIESRGMRAALESVTA
jgi:tagaturonate reductase